MSARLVHHRCLSLRAHFTLFNLKEPPCVRPSPPLSSSYLNSCLNVLLAQQALLHATGTRMAGNDVRARLKERIALVIGAHETFHGCARRQTRLSILMRLPVLSGRTGVTIRARRPVNGSILQILLRQYTAEMWIRTEIEGTLILLVSHG